MDKSANAPIVVGVSVGPGSDDAARWAAGQAQATGRSIRLVTAIWPPDDGEAQLLLRARSRAIAAIARTTDVIEAVAPAIAITSRLRIGTPESTLLEQSRDAWLTVIGRHNGSTAAHLLLDSAAVNLIGGPASPVVAVPPQTRPYEPGSPVVVGIDGSEASYAAAELAADLAIMHNAPLELCCAALSLECAPTAMRARFTAAEEILASVASHLPGNGTGLMINAHTTGSNAVAALIERSDRALLLVLGSRGQSGRRGPVLGAVCHTVADIARCPVVVAHPQVRQPSLRPVTTPV
ncbi:universal stress protein [Fodinicola acaciae]|uniref:universal stress protein n=1 Tax=Fodinicola acaciae TaxID=2681555 RepID=UPI0013D86E7D|nr:universal stress protein [Fodinicola acaciae]